jgi:hypothetical protein
MSLQRNGDANGRSIVISTNRPMADLMKNAITPFSALFGRHKILHQALMAKTAESIAQGGLYDVHAQANNNFPQNNRDLSA